jgi:MFS family permease
MVYFQIWISLALFRFLLGIGIGGEYPLSATVRPRALTPS